jgi:hypothetical protein
MTNSAAYYISTTGVSLLGGGRVDIAEYKPANSERNAIRPVNEWQNPQFFELGWTKG